LGGAQGGRRGALRLHECISPVSPFLPCPFPPPQQRSFSTSSGTTADNNDDDQPLQADGARRHGSGSPRRPIVRSPGPAVGGDAEARDDTRRESPRREFPDWAGAMEGRHRSTATGLELLVCLREAQSLAGRGRRRWNGVSVCIQCERIRTSALQ